ncbi:uncharacterized protein LOC125498608 [Beta vulgaris subsp. vulgaris]|uniref:uncharacterized protein LOC125498608 n=1 Tax=Beta vulgaris subsp. vulgaris TaxID=3555 RepID=UPI00203763C8|nr:uncharacterized protein LOC125498608 [Beta vulgaris subsp. vulgaris]
MNGTVTEVRLEESRDPIVNPVSKSSPAQLVVDASQKWKGFTGQSRMGEKGMGLSFIAPVVVDGKPTAKLDKKAIDMLSEQWANALIMYVVGQNPTINAMNAYLKSQWSLSLEPTVYKHEAGYFIAKFCSQEDRDSIIYAGPHLFYGKPLIVKQWTASFDFHKEVLKVIPIWVRLPNLPLNCWSDDSLSRIGSLLGVPIYADECTTKIFRVSFARILVEMDVTKEIPKVLTIEDPSGKVFSQQVIYDWLPAYCNKCQVIGHNCAHSLAKKSVKEVLKWVPKSTAPAVEVNPPAPSVEVTDNIGAPPLVVDPSSTGEPTKEVELSITETTPVNTPIQGGEEEEPWKVVTRKSKGKQVSFQSARVCSFSQEPGRPGGARGPNPYLS